MPRADGRYYAQQPYVLAQDFSSLSGFTISGSPTIAEIVTDKVQTGTGSLKVQASGSAVTTIDWSITPFTIARDNPLNITFRVWLPNASNVSSFLFYISTTTDFSAGTWAVATVTGFEPEDQALFQTGWCSVTVTRASFLSGTPTILDNPANSFIFARLRLEIGKGPIWFDALYTSGKSHPMIQMQFDDGSDTLFTQAGATYGGSHSAASYMNSLGIKGSLNLNSRTIGTAGYLSVAQCNTLYHDYGWDLCNHTASHANITLLTDAQIKAELEECDVIFQTNGWERGRKHFVYPTGAFTVGTHPALIKKLGYFTARSIQSTLIVDQYAPIGMHNLWMHGINSTIPASQVITKWNQARKQGYMAGVYFHGLGTVDSGPTKSFAEHKLLVDDMYRAEKEGRSTNVTASQWYEGLFDARRTR